MLSSLIINPSMSIMSHTKVIHIFEFSCANGYWRNDLVNDLFKRDTISCTLNVALVSMVTET